MLHSLWAAIAAKTIFISNYIVQGLFYLIAMCFTDTIVHQAGIPRYSTEQGTTASTLYNTISSVLRQARVGAHLRMTNVYFGHVISKSSCCDRTSWTSESGSIPSTDDRAGRCDDENFMTYQLGSSTTDEPFQNTTYHCSKFKKNNYLFSLWSLLPTTFFDQISPNLWPK